MSETVLVAGASGFLGTEICRTLKEDGRSVRALTRSEAKAKRLREMVDDVRVADAIEPAQLQGVCDGVSAIVSALGASVSTAPADRAPYSAVDTIANRNLLQEAKRAGVKKFVYVAVFSQPGYDRTRYMRAHEAFVNDLRASGIAYAVVRPTGFFSAMEEFLVMAKRGVFPLISGGTVRTNPIHLSDLARVCVNALAGGENEVACGGPDVLTRKQIGELAFAAIGKKPKFVTVPVVFLKIFSVLVRLVHPRLGELLEFVAAVSVTDCVAPIRGERRLEDYYRELVAGQPENTKPTELDCS